LLSINGPVAHTLGGVDGGSGLALHNLAENIKGPGPVGKLVAIATHGLPSAQTDKSNADNGHDDDERDGVHGSPRRGRDALHGSVSLTTDTCGTHRRRGGVGVEVAAGPSTMAGCEHCHNARYQLARSL
jgi:hypothetical protein